MSDLISRDAAIEAICTQGTHAERDGQCVISLATAKQRAVDILEAIPTAEKVGKWMLFSPKSHLSSCSLCGQWADRWWNYCPNCGARMEGEEDERNPNQSE